MGDGCRIGRAARSPGRHSCSPPAGSRAGSAGYGPRATTIAEISIPDSTLAVEVAELRRDVVTVSSLSTDRWIEGRAVVRAADPRMAALVDARPRLDPDAFFDTWPADVWTALVSQVIGQQLSLAAAGAIRARLSALHGGRVPTPAEMLTTDEDTLRGVGLSRAKVVYLRDIAARLVDGRIDVNRLRTLDDDGVRSELTRAKGVGRFTADGVLLLAFRRADIWPAADLSLRRGVAHVWELDRRLTVAEADAVGERFRPWRTLAAVYLLTLDVA